MNKTVGILGGIGPESTIDYYRSLISLYREQNPDGGYPSVIINSIDLKKMLDLVAANDLVGVTGYLVEGMLTLARAGAHFGLMAANTPHIVFDEVRRQSPIPLMSIVEATCEAAQAIGLKRAGLFGTRFTMQGRFYPDVFSKNGITIAVPRLDEQTYIHHKYMTELVNGVIRPETREQFLKIIDRLKDEERIEALILGGTELPLLLRDVPNPTVPFLDTTAIHVKSCYRRTRTGAVTFISSGRSLRGAVIRDRNPCASAERHFEIAVQRFVQDRQGQRRRRSWFRH